MSRISNIFKFGVKDGMSEFQKRTITLSNQISLLFSIVILGLILLLTLKLQSYNTAALFGGLFVLLVLIPFINKMGATKLSGFFVSSIIPIVIVGAAVLTKLNVTGDLDLSLFIAPRILLIGTLILPLILIDYRNVGFFVSSLTVYLVAIIGFSELHNYLGIGIDRAVFNSDTFFVTIVVSIFSMLTLVLSILFFQRLNVKSEEDILQKNVFLDKQKSELQLLQDGTEKINVELVKQRFEVEESKQRLEQNNKELEEYSKHQEVLTQEVFAKSLAIEQSKQDIQNFAKEQEKLTQKVYAKSLETEQANFEIERAYKNLKVLGDIGKKIIPLLTVKDILRSAYKNISELMNISFFAIGIYNEKKQRIDFFGTIKDNKKLDPYFYNLSRKDSFSVWCYKNKDEIYINNLDQDYGKYFDEYPDLQHFKAKSFIYCPLFSADKTIGTIAVHHKDINAFTDNNLFVMRTIATYISLAIQNADSYTKIEEQMTEIKDKNIMVESSLNYAKTIQSSMLPSDHILANEYKTELVFFPRDIVSGDFYWTANIFNRRKFVTAVDCTGHGVPGAFLSFVGSKSLDEIVHNKQIFSPKKILAALDDNIVKILNQEYSNNRDGMDVAMCAIEELKGGKMKVLFSGAKSPLFYYTKVNKTVNYLKGSRKAIGGGYYDKHEFEEHELLLEKGDILYVATDGFIDQNSSEHKRFGRERFMGMIEQIAEFPIAKQRAFMKQIFNKFKGEDMQRDDVTVLITEL